MPPTPSSHDRGVHLTLWITFSFLVGSVFCGWIDPDTRGKYQTTKSLFDGKEYTLVFSDEFNVEGRNFSDGYDPRWTSIDKDDYTNFALHYYKNDHVTTKNGYLNLTTTTEKFTFPTVSGEKTKYYKSAMIQGWDKFCFTGSFSAPY
jgi:beta-glucanase (GH16 family)